MARITVAAALFGASLVGLTLPLAGAQSSTLLRSATPESLTPLLRAAGYTVTLDRSGKSPFLKVENKDEGTDFYIDFLNCNASSCDGAYANVLYDLKDLKSAPDLKKINAWNQEYFSQAYLDDNGKPHLISPYSFVGGFTGASFMNWIAAFYGELNDFYELLNK
ncbi:hypothetical protein DKM44_03785 [Deinococcus irradiatisoli]|uniref:YbjN domain-containing protein n=1 Tax=Deinococcus irradiatisoli TaxID=2202254 RepID=A0A2Z3JBW9_9DEIO|nr:YbjN domain-containing protein [Deinococcus irradiatisoli]AWN22465.1 hypothetical protein DKM44_03785 [Deinococcus irradiatisoli]